MTERKEQSGFLPNQAFYAEKRVFGTFFLQLFCNL